jgi:hypothetical protein
VLVDEIEREQRVPQVVEDAHEQHEVEALLQAADLVDRHLLELDVDAQQLGREAGLRQVASSLSMPSTRSAPRRFISIEWKPALQPMSSTVAPRRSAGSAGAMRAHLARG